jgi:hypothetical protein
MNPEIIVVSGLPRSGTSLMMQMLARGGLEVVTDHVRTADTDNPRGYYELEKAKSIKRDASWLPEARGKVVKMVSKLLYDLPASERYRVVFMERDLDEVLLSQEKMLKRLGRSAAPREKMKEWFTLHLQELHQWLAQQKHIEILCISYNDLIERPAGQAELVNIFLGGKGNADRMTAAVDPSLYRNRKPPTDPASLSEHYESLD